MATYTFAIPRYVPPSLNQLLRRHWTFRLRAQKEADDLVGHYATQANVPTATLKRRVSLVFRSPGRLPDVDNLLKVILDALKHCGLVVDDSPRWLELGDVRAENGPRSVEVTLEDVA